MNRRAPLSFGRQLKRLREAAGFTQEELATVSGLSVHAISALERGERRRPHVDTVRALSAALDLTGGVRDALVGSARAPAPAAEELGETRIPLPPTRLIGRDDDVSTLRKWLADSSARLISIIGPGGVGKTRLALALAHALAERGSLRVRFVSLASLRDRTLVAPTIAEALGLADVSAADLPQRARVACGGRPTLLVLDNFEQVMDAAPVVADLLASAAELRLLVTSRAPLHVRGEREYALGPLPLETNVETTSPAELARVPAIRLLVERARDVRPGFRVTPANGSTLAAICRRLDALPLALELAAPWVKVLPPEDLLRRLEQDVLLTPAAPRDLPERQQTMNATVAWSYQLLDADQQRAFRYLGVIPGAFSIDAAEAVLAGSLDTTAGSTACLQLVGALVDRSLLQRQSDTSGEIASSRFLMLDTIRAYAMHELGAAGERDAALEGLSRHCVRQATLAGDGLVGPAQAEWLDRVREDLASYRTVLSWLIEQRRPGEAAEVAWRLLWFWAIRGYTVEGLHWYEQVLSLPSIQPAVEARALLGASAMRHVRGDLDRARACLLRALKVAARSGDVEATVQADWILGNVEHAAGHQDAARARLTRSLDGFRALARPWGTGQALTGLACVALATRDASQAEHLLDEATSALRDAGPWFLSLVSNMRATLAIRRGDPDQAFALAGETLACVRDLKDRFAFVYALVPLAAAAVLKGDDLWAARIMGMRDAVTESTGASFLESSVDDLVESLDGARARLGPEAWSRAYAVGRQVSIDVLLEDLERMRSRPASGRH